MELLSLAEHNVFVMMFGNMYLPVFALLNYTVK